MLSASEIANSLGIKDPAFREKLKDWTKQGLMPVSKRHPGTGRHRSYGGDAVKMARALMLMNMLGMRVAGKRKFVERVANDAGLMDALEYLTDEALVNR